MRLRSHKKENDLFNETGCSVSKNKCDTGCLGFVGFFTKKGEGGHKPYYLHALPGH